MSARQYLLLVTMAAAVIPASAQQLVPTAAPANIARKTPLLPRISPAYGVTGTFHGSSRLRLVPVQ